MSDFDFEAAREAYRQRSERALASRLPGAAEVPQRLCQAIRHACLSGGKRFRATLVYACGEVAGAAAQQLDAAAAAVEMIHAYSLVHDDLPAMDDDDLRRGQPSCHMAFDEATAILAGDALQARAFEILSADPDPDSNSDSDPDSDPAPAPAFPAERRLQMVETLAWAAGTRGMAGGQALDMAATGAPANLAELRRIHRLKTGALIRASARLGGLASPRAGEELLESLDEYAANVGLAFQIVDDILDGTAASETLGKRGGADRRMQKATYLTMLGVEKARAEARNLCRNALESAASLGDNAIFLQQLAHFAIHRTS